MGIPRQSQTALRSEATGSRGSFHIAVYVVAILSVLYGSFALNVRQSGIFACPASEYGEDAYLAYCEAASYGDYDHGAVWYGLEPIVRQQAANADILFIGSSRLQFALSAPALEEWFAKAQRKYYLLGFSHFENVTFLAPLVSSLHPRARAYVVNIDDFFSVSESGPGGEVMHVENTRARYDRKKLWQVPHKIICGASPALCGNSVSYFRRRHDGFWSWAGAQGLTPAEVGDPGAVTPHLDQAVVVSGKSFLSQLGVRPDCVFLSYVPAEKNQRASAAALAAALGYELISPPLSQLRTFDSSHLDKASAHRFAKAFMDTLGPQLDECLAGS